jgi:CheY-like chemotaxis protein
MTHKILTIDDHPDTLTAIVDTLQQYGYQVFSSLSPFEGLEMAAAEQPDLILLDVNMPGMDGTEVARQLRANEQLAHIPIIMFTAEQLPEQKLAGFEAGADDYLLKPTDPDIMIERIEAMLGGPPTPPVPGTLSVASTILAPKSQATLPPSPIRGAVQGKIIALVGAHGGAGTTTLAINLAMAMAEADMPTTLIDYDLIQGHIALYLKQKDFSQSLNQLAQQLLDDPDAGHVHRALIHYQTNLQLLLAEPNPLREAPLPQPEQTLFLLQTLYESGGTVIVDLGRGIDKQSWPIIERADDIYVVVQPNRVGLASARFLLAKLEKSSLFDAYLAVIAFHVGSSSVAADSIEQYLKRPLLALVTAHPKEIALSINRAIPLVHMEQSPAGDAIRQIVQKMVSVE